MNDYVFGREDAIDLSLATLASVNYLVAAICLGLSLKPLREALRLVGQAAGRTA